MPQETDIAASPERSPEAAPPKPVRRGAVGKALLVWLGTGSIGAAVVALIIFWAIGC